jgi:hypothetical protein
LRNLSVQRVEKQETPEHSLHPPPEPTVDFEYFS